MNAAKQDALEEIVAIARRHALTAADIKAALLQGGDPSASVLPRIFAYVGGTLLLAGLCILFGTLWDELGSPARVLLPLAGGIALLIAGFGAARTNPDTRAATPLFLAGLLLETGGLAALLHEYGGGGDPAHAVLFISGAMLAQQVALLRHSRRAVFSFFALFFGLSFCAQLMDLAGMAPDIIALALGASLLLIGQSVLARPHAAVMPFWAFCGAALVLLASFGIVYKSPYEFLYIGIAAAVMYIALLFRSRSMLFLATAAMLGFICYFTAGHFGDALGWPLALIISGAAFMALGSLAVKLHARLVKAS